MVYMKLQQKCAVYIDVGVDQLWQRAGGADHTPVIPLAIA